MTFRYGSQEIMPFTMSSPAPPPTQGDQTAEQDDQRSNDTSDDRTDSSPTKP